MHGGPFAGLYTTAERAHVLEEMQQIARAYDRPGGRILVLYEYPGLYLYSKMRPSTNCVWQVPGGDQEGLLEAWEKAPKGHRIVVRVKGSGVGRIDSIVAPPERRIFETPHLVVYGDG